MLLVLASASSARRALLSAAGLNFHVIPANIDESQLIAACPAYTPEQTAGMLAEGKALSVSRENQTSLIIGADQVLVCDGQLYQKAKNLQDARNNMARLAGRTHQLISAVCVAQGNKVVWRHHQAATLTMKSLDGGQIDRYLAAAGDAALKAVGGYELEGKGAWLFEAIEGDHFTILGLPLLPLLDFLAGKGFGPMAPA